MNSAVAFAISLVLPAVSDCRVETTLVEFCEMAVRLAIGPAAVANVAEDAVSRAFSDADDVVYAGKGSRGKSKKHKAVNPWPVTDFDDELLNIIMGCIGIVVCVILAIISYRNGW